MAARVNEARHEGLGGGPPEDLETTRQAALADQMRIIETKAPLAVDACPGAGKTRMLVERHCRSGSQSRQGRAIVSFTRAAVAQVRERAVSVNRPDLMSHPNIVTTIDTFFWRILVRPFLPVGDSGAPKWQRLDQGWRQAPRQHRYFHRRHNSVDSYYDLADFQFTVNPETLGLTAHYSRYGSNGFGNGSLTEPQITAIYEHAERQRKWLVSNRRLLTGEEVRAWALANLGKESIYLKATLPQRFSELIVDEAQDCSDADTAILERLHALGLPIVIIGDPDQAIYRFRNSGTDAVQRLFSLLPRRTITGNWRSTTTICKVSATLRTSLGHRPADVSLVDDESSNVIHLMTGGAFAVAEDFVKIAVKAGISAEERLILAHGSSSLPGPVKSTRHHPKNASAAIAWAAALARDPGTASREREKAHEILRAGLLRRCVEGADEQTAQDTIRQYRLDPRMLDAAVRTVAMTLPDLGLEARVWCKLTNEILARVAMDELGIQPGGIELKAPKGLGGESMSKAAGVNDYGSNGIDARISTIHSAKGTEADAVLVIIPDAVSRRGGEPDQRNEHVLHLWTRGRTGTPAPTAELQAKADEALRVLYVGASRARRLLAFALPEQHRSGVRGLFDEKGIPYDDHTAALF